MPTPIKPEDLRVGNLVQSKYGKTIVVESIIDYGINLQAGDGNCMYCDYKESEIFGIPLTEEWLLNFGFIIRDKKYSLNYGGESKRFAFLENPDFILYFHKRHGQTLFNTQDGFRSSDFAISYVHQLQNLYCFLSGKELTFKC